ncbi:MAG: adenosylcobinamide-phosphate synthase CbiB [Bacillota bacterium]
MARVVLSMSALAVAFILDCLIGDPPNWQHPVRYLGAAIDYLDKSSRKLFYSAKGLKIAGLLITVITAGGVFVLSVLFLSAAYRLHPFAGWLLEVYLFFVLLAGGDLHRHVSKVRSHLATGDLEKARLSAAMLVSRDTSAMDEKGLSRCALESLFENSADGLIAPLFFIAVGGAPLAVLYKAVNTLDSMLGYKNKDYADLGFFPARLDDILSYLPSRLTAVLFLLAGGLQGGFKRGLKVLAADRNKHDSPNSAWPEAAAAGVLGIKFGGADYYRGQLINRPVINRAGKAPGAKDIARGLTLFWVTALLAFGLFLYLYYRLETGEVFIL